MPAAADPPSALLEAQAARLREAAALGPVLDLACGGGRNALAAAALGARSVGLDRDREALARLAAAARARGLAGRCAAVRADLEAGHGIPVAEGRAGAVLVFRFLHRPLAAAIERALAPGGLLLYETFTRAQGALAHGPRRARFLLEPGELPRLFPGLEVLAHEELATGGERPEHLARLVARRPRAGAESS